MAEERVISLALQEGFRDDSVRVAAGDREIAKVDGVSTRVQTGVARQLDVALPAGETRLVVEIPSRQLKTVIDIGPDAKAHWGVSVDPYSGEISVKSSDVPFGYV